MPRGKKISAFSYPGSKYSHLDWLLPLLPPTNVFVDVFGGSAAVLLNRAPSRYEIYNDINGHVVNFFRVLRDPAKTEALISQLRNTPYSREEFAEAHSECEDDVERARRFYIRARQSFSGKMGDRTWDISIGPTAPKAHTWKRAVDGLGVVAERLREIHIEHARWRKVLETYDGPQTLFYIDPPYGDVSGNVTEAFGGVFGIAEHMDLSDAVKRLEGKVAVSGYAGMYDALYERWCRHEETARLTTMSRNGKALRAEVLWTNYELPKGVDDANRVD